MERGGPQALTALADLLGQVGREMADLAGEIEALQETVSGLLLTAPLDPTTMERAQAIDHVLQHLVQLGQIIERTGAEADPDWRLDASGILTGVSLSALAARINGDGCNRSASGDLDLF